MKCSTRVSFFFVLLLLLSGAAIISMAELLAGTDVTAEAALLSPGYIGCGGVIAPLINGDYEQELVELINAERTSRDLMPVRRVVELDRAARYHATDMGQEGYFSHHTYDGGVLVCEFLERIHSFGYRGPLGEALAGGQATPEVVVGFWMDDASHRDLILEPGYREVGAGYYTGGYWNHVWVLNFGVYGGTEYASPDEVTINGPQTGFVGEARTFLATVMPLTSTMPISYSWNATGQTPVRHTSGLSDTVAFNWDIPGTQVITVTASNEVGIVTDTHSIAIGHGTTVDPIYGGSLVYTDTQGNSTTIEVPSGAVTETTRLAYTPLYSVTAPTGFSLAGHAFALDAYRAGTLISSLTFERPVAVTIHYSDSDVAGLDENMLELLYWNGQEWVSDGINLFRRDIARNYVVFTVSHLSEFGLFGKRMAPLRFSVEKTVTPTGNVKFGDELTYTLAISAPAGVQLGLYDPLVDTAFRRLIEQPPGVIHMDGIITGSLQVTLSSRITVSFVVKVGVPGTAGVTVDVTNSACIYPLGGTLGGCIWSNEVTNLASWPCALDLPLVLRNY
jgi:uncharacterized protein YkwD